MLQGCGTGPDPWHCTLLLRKTTRAMFPTLKDTKQYLSILCIGLRTLFASHNKFLFKFFCESIEFGDSYRVNSSETIIKVQMTRSIKNKTMSKFSVCPGKNSLHHCFTQLLLHSSAGYERLWKQENNNF